MYKNELQIPELSLVVLVGVSGSGKSTFARRLFRSTEIVSSDTCRAIVSDHERDQSATKDAFELLHYIAGKRLKNGLLTVIDATNVQPESRKSLVQLARKYHCLPVAIVLDVPEKICKERNVHRTDRDFGDHVIPQQRSQLRRSVKNLKREGFRHIHVLESVAAIDAVGKIRRDPLYSSRLAETGPFDIIGDVHGCFDELQALLERMGYVIERVDDLENFGFQITPSAGRKVVFVGDLVDRGPDSLSVLKLVMSMVIGGSAFCVPGNHDMKLHRYLNGKNVQIQHGLEQTVAQMTSETDVFRKQVSEFLYGLVSHYVFDHGKLVVAHAGLREEMHGRGSGEVRSFCLYGETTGETDEFGLPVRGNWAADYRGKAMVVYGHTPVPEAQWFNKTIDIDTGCVFGGKLTALRYPELELVAISAKQVYSEPKRPLDIHPFGFTDQQIEDDLLDIADVTGKRVVNTRLLPGITLNAENSAAALEVMSRFAIHPKWLIYLPPTMSPCETSQLDNYLEHPAEALNYYRKQGVEKVICEEKHMGSRAIVIACQNESVSQKRFGIENGGIGVCYTRTGRRFFTDEVLEKAFLGRIQNALKNSGFWEKFQTDWVCLDTELMPWSVKAQALLRDQYASVGTAANHALEHVVAELECTAQRDPAGIRGLLEMYREKGDLISKYQEVYRRYCWPVSGLSDLKLAPFHLLATEGEVHMGKTHEWHLQQIHEFCASDPEFLVATSSQIIDLSDENQVQLAIDWWMQLTEQGGEGMVVKPLDFIKSGKKELVQPAVKCRGREYLRIIYGPEYTTSANLLLLKNRNLGLKRSLALREFALGAESLERFVKKVPLRRVHECVLGILALESEPVDPRL